MKWLSIPLIIGVYAASGFAAEAQGRYGNSFSAEQAKSARDKGDIVSLGTIFNDLKRRYGGYQIDANLFNRDGGPVYVIDWMTGKGERMRITVNARTGRILS